MKHILFLSTLIIFTPYLLLAETTELIKTDRVHYLLTNLSLPESEIKELVTTVKESMAECSYQKDELMYASKDQQYINVVVGTGAETEALWNETSDKRLQSSRIPPAPYGAFYSFGTERTSSRTKSIKDLARVVSQKLCTPSFDTALYDMHTLPVAMRMGQEYINLEKSCAEEITEKCYRVTPSMMLFQALSKLVLPKYKKIETKNSVSFIPISNTLSPYTGPHDQPYEIRLRTMFEGNSDEPSAAELTLIRLSDTEQLCQRTLQIDKSVDSDGVENFFSSATERNILKWIANCLK